MSSTALCALLGGTVACSVLMNVYFGILVLTVVVSFFYDFHLLCSAFVSAIVHSASDKRWIDPSVVCNS